MKGPPPIASMRYAMKRIPYAIVSTMPKTKPGAQTQEPSKLRRAVGKTNTQTNAILTEAVNLAKQAAAKAGVYHLPAETRRALLTVLGRRKRGTVYVACYSGMESARRRSRMYPQPPTGRRLSPGPNDSIPVPAWMPQSTQSERWPHRLVCGGRGASRRRHRRCTYRVRVRGGQ